MSNTNTGGPAFPVPLNPGQSWQGMAPCDGMTMRDYFAAKAMHGFITNIDKRRSDLIDVPQLAKSSYSIADAMLKARDNQE
jgi:hypothetical protein